MIFLSRNEVFNCYIKSFSESSTSLVLSEFYSSFTSISDKSRSYGPDVIYRISHDDIIQ